MDKQQRGSATEELALHYLQVQGLSLLQRNYTRRVGEIDLIMRDPDQQSIVFVEVRYRQRSDFGGGTASVNWRKQRKLKRTVAAWLQKHADATQLARLDVLAVGPRVQAGPITRAAHDNAKSQPDASITSAYSRVVDDIYAGYCLRWTINAIDDDG